MIYLFDFIIYFIRVLRRLGMAGWWREKNQPCGAGLGSCSESPNPIPHYSTKKIREQFHLWYRQNEDQNFRLLVLNRFY